VVGARRPNGCPDCHFGFALYPLKRPDELRVITDEIGHDLLSFSSNILELFDLKDAVNFSELNQLIVDRPETGEFSVHRDIFRDPEIFELEMKHVFEGTWVFIGLGSQIAKPHD
jgi:hypothetical protein